MISAAIAIIGCAVAALVLAAGAGCWLGARCFNSAVEGWLSR
jgi:hypothetical protein